MVCIVDHLTTLVRCLDCERALVQTLVRNSDCESSLVQTSVRYADCERALVSDFVGCGVRTGSFPGICTGPGFHFLLLTSRGLVDVTHEVDQRFAARLRQQERQCARGERGQPEENGGEHQRGAVLWKAKAEETFRPGETLSSAGGGECGRHR